VHDHAFIEENGRTRMIDHLVFAAPLGILGILADRVAVIKAEAGR